MMANNYYRVCTSLNDKGILVPEGTNFDKFTEGEAYVSAFKYNEEHFKQFKKLGSIAGITDVKSDDFYFDLDCKGDIEQARKDAVEIYDRLVQHGINDDSIKVYYSGSKGFHINLKLDQEYFPKEIKQMAVNIAGDLQSFDSSIYNANRIIRMEGSLHPKTQLRKTLLSVDELKNNSIAEIKTLAKGVYEYVKPKKVSLPRSIRRFITKEQRKEIKKLRKQSNALTVDYLSNPFSLKPRKLAISQGIFPSGDRSNALMILGSTLRNKGLLKEQCYFQLKAAADLQSQKYESEKFPKEEIWNNIVEQVYKATWKGGEYAEENFPISLQTFYDELGIPLGTESELLQSKYEPTRLSDIGDIFEDFVLNFDKNVIKTGINPLDKDMPLTPGMNLGVIGAAGAGKTAMALKILEYCSKNNIHVILASVDMNSTRLYEKILYRITGLSREELYEKFRNGEGEEIKAQVRDVFKTVYVYDKSACTIEDIRKYHKSIEARDGVKIKMTMVDYFERVNTDISEDTAASKKIAGEWQDYINDFNIVGVMYVQPNKMGISSGPNEPILNYTKIKGSSFLYQSFRGIISLWRPFYSPETSMYDNYMQMALLKNDLGELNMYDFGWNGKRGDIFELDPTAKARFKVLLEEIKAEKEDKDGY